MSESIPVGGLHPRLDDEGHAIGSPPPEEPTDVPAARVEEETGRTEAAPVS